MKILIIEDEPSLRELMEKSLIKEGYIVELAESYAKADDKISAYDYDCILLDIMLPDGNGLKLLEKIKKLKKRDNVIIISAKDSLEDKVKGLELGADDYIAKPFHLMELNARIKSITRRSNNGGKLGYYIGNLFLDPDTKKVTVNGEERHLPKKEFDILSFFMPRPHHLIDKSVRAEGVWGDHIDNVSNYDFLYAQMKNLRNKLKSSDANIEIKSVYGFGYKLTLDEE